MNIPKREQIKSVLEAKEQCLAEKYGFKDPKDIPWSISKKDVRDYIDQKGFPNGGVYFSENTYDGVYLLKENFFWTVSFKERGGVYFKESFLTKKKAMDFLIDAVYFKPNGISG